MSAQPAPAVLAAMQTVADVMAWVPIQGEVLAAVYAELGVSAGDPVRTLANI